MCESTKTMLLMKNKHRRDSYLTFLPLEDHANL